MKIDNPAFNYDKYGQQYSGQRRTDPRIAAIIHAALGDARTVLNLGAGRPEALLDKEVRKRLNPPGAS